MTALKRYTLPDGGVDIRAELGAHQRALLEQALERARGDVALAAQLLSVTPIELTRMQAGHLLGRARRGASTSDDREPLSTERPRPRIALVPIASRELPRIEQRNGSSVEVISRSGIRRLDAEGYSPRQIANRLGINQFVVEKVLRERALPLAKCGARPSRERKA